MQSEDKNGSVQLSTRYQQYDFAKRHLGGFGGRKVFPITRSNGENIRTSENDEHQSNRSSISSGRYLPNTQHITGREAYAIRRLTPTECERLMGLPDVEKTVIIEVCEDNQKKIANVEDQNLKSQKLVGNVEENKKQDNVLSANENIQSKNLPINELAQLNVQVLYDEKSIKIWQKGKETELWLNANNVEKKANLPNQGFVENFAQLVAGLNIMSEKITPNGKVELHPNGQLSILQENGNKLLKLYGEEMMQGVKNVEKGSTIPRELLKSITSKDSNIKKTEQDIQTYCFSVIRVITGFIPEEILRESLSLRIEIKSKLGWTAEGTEGKISDTQRYKLCGNGVVVNVVEEIVKRLIK